VTLRCAELFVGAGGMSLGLYEAGFDCVWAGEANKHACATYRHAFPEVPLTEAKLEGTELGFALGSLDLIAGGPPCQPFSAAGHGKGEWDARDGFPIVLRAVQFTRPRAVLIENVRGFLAPTHTAYRESIVRELEALGYTVQFKLLNAADYGVPQRRLRVFIVGFWHPPDAARFRWPTATHSLEALVLAKYVTQTLPGADRPPSRVESAALRILRAEEPRPGTKRHAAWVVAQERAKLLPWVTLRAVLGPLVQGLDATAPHVDRGHPASPADFPAHTVVAGSKGSGAGHNLVQHEAPTTPYTSPKHSAMKIDEPGNAVCAGTHGVGGGHGVVEYDLVDAGRGGHYGEGKRSKSLLYKNALPDLPSATVQAAAEAKNSEHAIRVVLETKSGRFRTDERSLDGPSSSCVAASWAKDRPRLSVRNIGAGDGPGASMDAPSPTVPAVAGGQAGLAVMGGDTHAWTSQTGAEQGRVHTRPKTIIRRLTVTEVAALQAFPAWWPWQGPVTQVYRQIGNAVPPPLATAVGGAIYEALSGET